MTTINLTGHDVPGVTRRDGTAKVLEFAQAIHRHPEVLILVLMNDPGLVARLIQPFPALEKQVIAAFNRPGAGRGRPQHSNSLRNLVSNIFQQIAEANPGAKVTAVDAEVSDYFKHPIFKKLFGKVTVDAVRHKIPSDVRARFRQLKTRKRRGNSD